MYGMMLKINGISIRLNGNTFNRRWMNQHRGKTNKLHMTLCPSDRICCPRFQREQGPLDVN